MRNIILCDKCGGVLDIAYVMGVTADTADGKLPDDYYSKYEKAANKITAKVNFDLCYDCMCKVVESIEAAIKPQADESKDTEAQEDEAKTIEEAIKDTVMEKKTPKKKTGGQKVAKKKKWESEAEQEVKELEEKAKQVKDNCSPYVFNKYKRMSLEEKYGTVFALKNAGWKWWKIADEMGADDARKLSDSYNHYIKKHPEVVTKWKR